MKTKAELKRMRNKQNREGIFSIYSLLYSIIAIAIMLNLGIRHINDIDSYGVAWGRYALFHAGLGLIGLVTMLLISYRDIRANGLKKVDSDSVLYLFVTIIVIVLSQVLVQFISGYIPFSISDSEKALYHIFSSITEELFFRGFIITIFCYRTNRAIFKAIGVILSGIAFALFHQNYWDNIPVLIAIGIGGSLIAIVYIVSEFDYTAISLGHTTYNVIVTIKELSKIIV